MSINTNSVTATDLNNILQRLNKRVEQLELLLQGQPIAVVRIADASITNAKIQSLSVDKLETGTLSVLVSIYLRNESDTANQGLIGYQESGF
jgi:hypothetical protein